MEPWDKIIKVDQQVCSLDISKKLKDLQVPQEGLFFYYEAQLQSGAVLVAPQYCDFAAGNVCRICWAPTATELGEWVPVAIKTENGAGCLECRKTFGNILRSSRTVWTVGYYGMDDDEHAFVEYEFTHKKLVDAMGSCLIYMLTNKIITLVTNEGENGRSRQK